MSTAQDDPKLTIFLVGFPEGAETQDARPPIERLQTTFGIDRALAQHFIDNMPVPVKRGASKEDARSYIQTLHAIGAEVRVEPDAPKKLPTGEAPPSTLSGQTAPARRPSKDVAASGLDEAWLDPTVGADPVIKPARAPIPTPAAPAPARAPIPTPVAPAPPPKEAARVPTPTDPAPPSDPKRVLTTTPHTPSAKLDAAPSKRVEPLTVQQVPAVKRAAMPTPSAEQAPKAPAPSGHSSIFEPDELLPDEKSRFSVEPSALFEPDPQPQQASLFGGKSETFELSQDWQLPEEPEADPVRPDAWLSDLGSPLSEHPSSLDVMEFKPTHQPPPKKKRTHDPRDDFDPNAQSMMGEQDEAPADFPLPGLMSTREFQAVVMEATARDDQGAYTIEYNDGSAPRPAAPPAQAARPAPPKTEPPARVAPPTKAEPPAPKPPQDHFGGRSSAYDELQMLGDSSTFGFGPSSALQRDPTAKADPSPFRVLGEDEEEIQHLRVRLPDLDEASDAKEAGLDPSLHNPDSLAAPDLFHASPDALPGALPEATGLHASAGPVADEDAPRAAPKRAPSTARPPEPNFKLNLPTDQRLAVRGADEDGGEPDAPRLPAAFDMSKIAEGIPSAGRIRVDGNRAQTPSGLWEMQARLSGAKPAITHPNNLADSMFEDEDDPKGPKKPPQARPSRPPSQAAVPARRPPSRGPSADLAPAMGSALAVGDGLDFWKSFPAALMAPLRGGIGWMFALFFPLLLAGCFMAAPGLIFRLILGFGALFAHMGLMGAYFSGSVQQGAEREPRAPSWPSPDWDTIKGDIIPRGAVLTLLSVILFAVPGFTASKLIMTTIEETTGINQMRTWRADEVFTDENNAPVVMTAADPPRALVDAKGNKVIVNPAENEVRVLVPAEGIKREPPKVGGKLLLFFLSLTLPLFYWPMALTVAALSGSLLNMFNPLFVLRAILKGGAKYATVAGTGALLMAGGWAAMIAVSSSVDSLLGGIFIAIVMFFFPSFLYTYVHGVQGHLIGRMVADHPDEFSEFNT